MAKRLGELLKCDVPLIADWLDESTMTIPDGRDEADRRRRSRARCSCSKTRASTTSRRVLWKAKPADLPKLAPKLAKFANEFADEARARSTSTKPSRPAASMRRSVVVPAAMERVALGKYVADEFDGPMMRCLDAQLVVFSGLKIDKLDDLEAMIDRGKIRRVFAAGSLAMALKKAAAELDGKECCLGVAEDPAHSDKPYYIPPSASSRPSG